METEVPQFKLAKIGGRRERKKGALPFFFGGGAGGGAVGAGGLGGLAAKIALAVLVSSLGVGAYNVGKSLAPQDGTGAQKQKAFASKEMPRRAGVDGSYAARTAPSEPSGLSMVSGSLDGKTPEQRAAEAAAAEAAAKEAADRQAKADAEAAKGTSPDAEAGGAPGGVDAAAMAAAAAKAGEAGGKPAATGPFASRFGSLSSGLGGGSGLAGGAGMSGGVGRSFDGQKMGLPKGFGAATAPARTTARAAVARGVGKTRSFRQLDRTARLSSAGRNASAAETGSTNADAPFSNNPGASNAITGGGAGTGAGTGTENPGGASSGGSPNPSGGGGSSGGPTTGTDGCPQGSEDPACTPADTAGHKDSTPWSGMVKMAAGLVILASLVLTAAAICSYMGNTPTTGYLKAWAQWLGGIAAALGFIVALLGASIMGAGGFQQGLMYTVSGAIITAAGIMVALNPASGHMASTLTIANWAVIGAAVGSLIGVGVGGAGLMSKSN